MTDNTKRGWKSVTSEEVQTIINMHNAKPKPTLKRIADKVNRGQSFVFYIIEKWENKDPKIIDMYDGIQSYRGTVGANHVGENIMFSGETDKVAEREVKSVTTVKTGDMPKSGTKEYNRQYYLNHIKKPQDGRNRTNNGNGATNTDTIKENPSAVPQKFVPGRHGAKKHELVDKYKNLDRKEFKFMKDAKNSNEFIVEYFKEFGYDKKTVSMLNEVWKRREDIIRYEDEKNHHTVKPKVTKIVAPRTEKERESMVDEDRLLPEINTNLLDMIELQKESIKLQSRIASVLGLA